MASSNTSTTDKWSLTEHLLTTYPDQYKTATQHPFLLAAAEGRLPKEVLARWLANDRLYIHSYIRAAGKLLAHIDLPRAAPKTGDEPYETQLVDWLIDALAGVRKEERFFIQVARRYGLSVDLPVLTPGPGVAVASQSKVDSSGKLPGLTMIQNIFSNITDAESPSPAPNTSLLTALSSKLTLSAAPPSTTPPPPLPWLEGAITFWGTERCYLDAWSWAKSKQAVVTKGADDANEDADGGALRNEFIPNWSSAEFARFVGQLEGLINSAVAEVLDRASSDEEKEAKKQEFIGRVDAKWKSLLAAEAAFWPDVE